MQEIMKKVFQNKTSTFVIPEQAPDAEIPEHHPADPDANHLKPYQNQDDVKNLLAAITARQTMHNNPHMFNQLASVDCDDPGYQKKLIKDKVYELGSKLLDFEKYKKFELWRAVKHDPGYINWLTRQPSPSNWLQHFLKVMNRYLDLKLRTLDYTSCMP